MKTGFAILFSAIVIFSHSKSAQAFDSFEHIWIGDSPMLQFPEDGLPEGEQLFTDYPYKRFIEPIAELYHVPRISPQYLTIGNLKFSVGEIVAIAGDYFTLVGSTISDADVKIPFNIRERFLYAFSSFIAGNLIEKESVLENPLQRGLDPNVTKLTHEYFAVYIQRFGHYVPWELRAEFDSVANPFKPEQSVAQLRAIFNAEFINLLETDPRLAEQLTVLKKINMDELSQLKEMIDRAYKSLSRIPSFLEEFRDLHTMLVSKKTTWNLIKETFNWNNPPFYSQILEENLDHFGDYAQQVYKAGHEVAIQTAQSAAKQKTKENQRKWLNIAYALDAFALHYLSDQFSSGHMRTPRTAIFQSSYFAKSAGLAANSMHDEDGYYGLIVENSEQRWNAYGDYSYFSERSKQNREELDRCLQASFDEVFEAFLTGTGDNKFRALELVPKIAKGSNFSPLFKVDSQGNVLVRDSYDDIDIKTYSRPSLISWLRSWTYTPHWKKSSFDVRWLLNQTAPQDTRTIEMRCSLDLFGNQQEFHVPVLGVQVDLEKMGIGEARTKYFGGARTTLLLSAEKVNQAVENCHQFAKSKMSGGKGVLRAFGSEPGGTQELKLVVTYNRNGAFVPQEFPIKL